MLLIGGSITWLWFSVTISEAPVVAANGTKTGDSRNFWKSPQYNSLADRDDLFCFLSSIALEHAKIWAF